MKEVLEDLPDWLMRREKRRISSLLGRCDPHRTLSTAPVLARSRLELLAFDDAYVELQVQPIRQAYPGAVKAKRRTGFK
jgi:hypothetical protein